MRLSFLILVSLMYAVGCNQYHFDMDDTDALSVTGIVASFNYNNGNGRHLANQDQTICIRREEGNHTSYYFLSKR